MKSVQRLKSLVRKTLLCAALALTTSGSVQATWNELPVTPTTDTLWYHSGVHDAGWDCYFASSTTNKIYVIYYEGGIWKAVTVATNCSSHYNSIGVDPSTHWCYYTGTDNKIWVAYWTGVGTTWNQVAVGTNINSGAQFCVDTVWHALWYVNNSGFLWVIYWNGSVWTETQMDGANARYRFERTCGADSNWHLFWYVKSDRKSLIATYWNGSSWVTTPGYGLLAGLDTYSGICAQESTHVVYSWQQDNAGVSTKGVALYLNGGTWTPATIFQDGNLPTTPGHCVPTPNAYACYFAGYSSQGCRFSNYSANARNWTSCRQDNSTMGGGMGLFPHGVSQNGRAILCSPANGGGGAARILYSDAP